MIYAADRMRHTVTVTLEEVAAPDIPGWELPFLEEQPVEGKMHFQDWKMLEIFLNSING